MKFEYQNVYQPICSYKKSQLGLSINTRTIIVSLPTEKFNELTVLLKIGITIGKTLLLRKLTPYQQAREYRHTMHLGTLLVPILAACYVTGPM